MEPKNETSFTGNPEDAGKLPVLVEIQVPKGQGFAENLQMASAIELPGFEVDSSFEPVPVSAPTEEAAANLSVGNQEIVVVRALIDDESLMSEIRQQPNVLEVWLDTPIAPFAVAQEEDTLQMVPTAAFGTCPIPPCDCIPGTAKGTLADVAKYLKADQIWAKGHRGQGIVVAIVDGGISAKNRIPNGKIPRVIGGWPADWGKLAYWGEHGNMTATDVLGIAPEAQLYDIRIAGGAVADSISKALTGYQWAIKQHQANGTPQILSNSWGIYQESWDKLYARNPGHVFTRKVVDAIKEGIHVLFAAGNCGQRCPSGKCGSDTGPGKSIWGANGHPLVMTVGAVNKNEHWIGYSSQGPAALDPKKPDFCSISHFKGYFSSDTGTSAACPVAAGVVALLKQAVPSLTPAQAKKTLKDTAKNIGSPGWDQHSGQGIIQAKGAYDRIVSMWHYNQTVIRTHAKVPSQMAWAYLQGMGWLRVKPNSPDGVTNVFEILCEALANSRKVDVFIQSGLITQATLR